MDMIYTLTLSPSLDYHFTCSELKAGSIIHAHKASFTPGGKGINVSSCLNKLGMENTALGFIGGRAGERIKLALDERGCKYDFVPIKGETRINVKINCEEQETAFNLDGPIIEEDKIKELYDRLDKLEFGDILIMGGSTGMIHRTIYAEIISYMNKKGILCALDASGVALKEGVKSKPFLIKPNIDELSELVGRNITSQEVEQVGKEVADKYGINYVLVSMGKEGAALISPTGIIKDRCSAKGEKVISTVGAGDCLLAGFIYMLSKGQRLEDCLHFGVQCGTAVCYLGHIPSKEEIEKI
jgi:1-phosphofructokinase